MKALDRQGNEVEVIFEREFAKVGDVVVVAIRDNKVKVWNDLLLSEASINAVKNELSKQVRTVETGKKRK